MEGKNIEEVSIHKQGFDPERLVSCTKVAGNIAGFSNQFMGVKQTTDILEKGTWLFAGIVAALCLFSTFFISSGSGSATNRAGDATVPTSSQPATLPGQTPPNAVPFDSGK